MTDRFKFRVYDPVKKTYYYDDFYIMCDGTGAIYTPLEEGEDENRLIIEQCTGLKDANDKLVFEGDILDVPFETFDGKSFSMRDLPCVVVHLNGFLMFQDKEGDFHYLDETEFAVLDKEFLAAEVIGNIHENPELMKSNTWEQSNETTGNQRGCRRRTIRRRYGAHQSRRQNNGRKSKRA